MKKLAVVLILLSFVLALAGCGDDTEKTYSVNITVDESTEAESTINGLTDGLCSWTKGGQDADGAGGDDYSFTPVIYINDNSFDSKKSITDEEISSESLTDTSVTINREKVNGIIINDSDYTIENSAIEVNADDADGTATSDFSGLGSALAVYGDSDVVVKDTTLKATGVAGMGIFVDRGARVLLDNVTMSSEGGTLYEDYVNSPDTKTMVAPPWILGIMGNSRCSNLMGQKSTMTVIDSKTSAANWAVLSTDDGSDMVLNVVNSSLALTGTDRELQAGGKFDTENPYTSINGYGTYVIGNAREVFLGTTMEVGTYAAIFTGGTASYGNLEKGESYELTAADGSTHITYEAEEDVQTVINSDTFGFMAHQQTNECTLDGIQVNTAFTDFLVKSGNDTTINIKNGAELNAENGILLQLMDNDDYTTEFDGKNMIFGEKHEEYDGFPSEAVAGGSASNTTVYNVTDTELEGAIYNGVGWNANELSNGKIQPMSLEVNLAGTASLKGPIAMTSCIHASYDGQAYLKENTITAFDDEEEASEFADEYQVTSFSQAEYFNIGQVANLVKSNGLNDIDVTLSDSSVWTVTDTSLVSSVKLSGDASVTVEEGATLTVGNKKYTEGTYTAEDF